MNEIEEVVLETIKRIAEEESIELNHVSESSSLVDELGFKSLHLARILAMLEIELEFDPFASGELAVTSVRTIGDLCAAYTR